MITTLKDILKVTERLNENCISFVLTNGCFDILHAGHVEYLRKAKELGHYLIVALNSDKSIRELKGKSRPINNEQSRSMMLDELVSVDYVFLFDKMIDVLRAIKPKIYAKGGDYTINTINQEERKYIESYGGHIHIIPSNINISTTEIYKKLYE